MTVEREIHARALRLLAAREYSRAELRAKLGKGEDDAALESVLDDMIERGFQSDERFADAYVRTKGTRLGAARLKHELQQRGVEPEIIEAALAQLADEGGAGDEHTRAREVWSRKFGVVPQDAKAWAKQARFLQSRGFSSSVIRQILKEVADEPVAGE